MITRRRLGSASSMLLWLFELAMDLCCSDGSDGGSGYQVETWPGDSVFQVENWPNSRPILDPVQCQSISGWGLLPRYSISHRPIPRTAVGQITDLASHLSHLESMGLRVLKVSFADCALDGPDCEMATKESAHGILACSLEKRERSFSFFHSCGSVI